MILVVGDFMVDEYVHVAIERISPEAPVPVMRELRRDYKPGGAGNVAANIHSMGEPVRLLTVIGQVESRWWNTMVEQCRWIGWINDNLRQTTVKTRFVAERGQQVSRLDCETTTDIGPQVEGRLKDSISMALRDVKVLVISDYQKGVITPRMARWLIDGAKELKIPVIVNSKRDSFHMFTGATIITCNEREYYMSENRIPNGSIAVVTRGENGMKIYDQGKIVGVTGERVEVGDVTGAGDTVVAALAVWIAEHGLDIERAATFANRAASIAVSHRGTHAVAREEIDT